MAAACACTGSSALARSSLSRLQQRPSLPAAAFQPLPPRRRTAVVQAAFNSTSAPKEISQPPREPQVPPAKYGFNDYAERINSRACMIGFFGLILVEAIFGKGFLQLIGVQVGRGIGFEI